MLLSQHRKRVAVMAGIILASAPFLAFSYWSNQYIERQGRADVERAAKRAIVLADGRISQVIAGLSDLTKRGIASCSSDHLEAMHRTAFMVTPIKEVSVVDPAGQTLCTNLGIPLGRREILSRPVATAISNFVVEVVRLDDGKEAFLRIRYLTSDVGGSLAALVPANLLLPKVSPHGGPFRTYARLTTPDGTVIDEGGAVIADENSEDRIVADLQSEHSGLIATASMSRASLLASYTEFRMLGILASLSVLILALAFVTYRRQRAHPISEIERGLARREFIPYYQPVLDITTGRLVGAEVLIRWRKANGTIIPPASFIPLAESSGLIFELTRSLMRQAVQDAGPAISRRPRFRLGFNLSARHFATETTIEEMRGIFSGGPIAFTQVVLEVTERQPLESLSTARRVIAGLQQLGMRIALDDIGTGHGGLSYLLKLGVDILKIDKLFVDAIGAERYSTTIIKSLVDLARGMRMDIVAEGVENFEQVAYLREQGIRYAQGYVFAPPLPGPSFLQLLEATDPVPRADGEDEIDLEEFSIPRYISARNRIAAA